MDLREIKNYKIRKTHIICKGIQNIECLLQYSIDEVTRNLVSSDTFQNRKFSGETCENSLTRQFKILLRVRSDMADDMFQKILTTATYFS